MPAVGIRCQTHLQLLKWCNSTVFKINTNQQKVKSAAFKTHQMTQLACFRKAKARFRTNQHFNRTNIQIKLSSQGHFTATENAVDGFGHGSNPT